MTIVPRASAVPHIHLCITLVSDLLCSCPNVTPLIKKAEISDIPIMLYDGQIRIGKKLGADVDSLLPKGVKMCHCQAQKPRRSGPGEKAPKNN